MGDFDIEISHEKLLEFYNDVVRANMGNSAYENYPDKEFSSWLFRKIKRKKMVIEDFLKFECQIRNRKYINKRTQSYAQRLTRTNKQFLDCSGLGNL